MSPLEVFHLGSHHSGDFFWRLLILEENILEVHIWRVSILESLHPGDPNLKIFHLRASIWGILYKSPSQHVHIWGVFMLVESPSWGVSVHPGVFLFQGWVPNWVVA